MYLISGPEEKLRTAKQRCRTSERENLPRNVHPAGYTQPCSERDGTLQQRSTLTKDEVRTLRGAGRRGWAQAGGLWENGDRALSWGIRGLSGTQRKPWLKRWGPGRVRAAVGRVLRVKTGFWAEPKVERGGHGALPPVTLTTAAGRKISRDLGRRRWLAAAAADLARAARGRRRGHGLRWEGTAKMASEGELGRKWDRCLADSAVKLGKGGGGRAEGEDPGRSGAGRLGRPGAGEGRRPAGPAARPGPARKGPARPGTPLRRSGPGLGRRRPRRAVGPGGASCGSALGAGRRCPRGSGTGVAGGSRGAPGPWQGDLGRGLGPPLGPLTGLFLPARPRLTRDPVAEGGFWPAVIPSVEDERFPWEISLCAELRGQRDASCPEWMGPGQAQPGPSVPRPCPPLLLLWRRLGFRNLFLQSCSHHSVYEVGCVY